MFCILFGHFWSKTSHFCSNWTVFFCLFVCGLLLPKLRHPAENQSLPSHYVLGLLAADVKLLPVLSDQSVAAEQMARLSAEVSAQQSRFVTLSKASPGCRAAKNGSTCPALRHPQEAIFFFLIFITKERLHKTTSFSTKLTPSGKKLVQTL